MAAKTNCVINGIPYFKKWAEINGKRKMVYGKSEKDWQKKVSVLQLESAQGLKRTNCTVEEAMEDWLFSVYAKAKITDSTFSIREWAYRKVVKGTELGSKRLSEVKHIDVQSFFNALDMPINSINNVHTLLNMFFTYVVEEGYLLKNPCKKIHKKESRKEVIQVYTADEIERIKVVLQTHRLRFLFLLALSTGLRQGELLALKHSDNGETIKVLMQRRKSKKIKYVNKKVVCTYSIEDGDLKTKASYREVPLPQNLAAEYKKHRAICQEEKLKLGKGKVLEDDYLFIGLKGDRLTPETIWKQWRKIQKAADVPYRPFHYLRHTFITKLVQSGQPIPTIMSLSGHALVSTMMGYTHIEMDKKKEAIEVMNEMLI